MTKLSPGHSALLLVQELVALVRERTSFRMFVQGSPHLKRLVDRAEDIDRDSTRGVAPYDLKPHGRGSELIGFCELCGSYHAERVEVRA